MACCDTLNDAQTYRTAMGVAALDRSGEVEMLRDALSRARQRAGGINGLDEATRRAWEAADDALTAHEVAVRGLVVLVQTAVIARASRNHAAAQSLSEISSCWRCLMYWPILGRCSYGLGRVLSLSFVLSGCSPQEAKTPLDKTQAVLDSCKAPLEKSREF